MHFLHNRKILHTFAEQKEANHNKENSVVRTFEAGESSLLLFNLTYYILRRRCVWLSPPEPVVARDLVNGRGPQA